MCLIAFAWNAHPDFRLVVGANRDEWHDRPTAPAAWWSDRPDILGGRDMKAGGTWMGISRQGRFAAVTNFRDADDKKSTARSRGELVTDFLASEATPEQFLSTIKQRSHEYNGYNLIVGNTISMAYFSSVRGEIETLAPGVYALSNHTLNEPWPKVKQARSALEEVLQAQMPEKARPPSPTTPLTLGARRAASSLLPLREVPGMRRAILDFLSDSTGAPDSALPNTGVGIEWERLLSPALIISPKYGTRASTVLSMTRDGEIAFVEHTRTADGAVRSVAEFHFEVRAD